MLTRLLVLQSLERRGPMHGYEIIARAEGMGLRVWGDLSAGSVYGVLARLEREGLVEVAGSKQSGRRPVRRIYQLTQTGRTEMVALRERLLDRVDLPQDPLDVALGASFDMPADALREAIRRRLVALEKQALGASQEYERRLAEGDLHVAGAAVFEHWEHRFRAEMEWHRRLLDLLRRPAGQVVTKRRPPGGRSEKRIVRDRGEHAHA